MTIGGITNNRLQSYSLRVTSFFFKKSKSKRKILAHQRDLKCKVQHFDDFFNLREASIFKIHFLFCDRVTD